MALQFLRVGRIVLYFKYCFSSKPSGFSVCEVVILLVLLALMSSKRGKKRGGGEKG